MILIDLDERLIALNDDANKGAAWSPSDRKWRPTSTEFAGRAWADGRTITAAQATSRFKADLEAIPTSLQ